MDIRVTSSNRIFYQVPTDIAALLMEAFPASFEKVEKTAPEKKIGSARFTFQRSSLTGAEPHIHYACDACSQGGYLLNSHPLGTPGCSAAKYAEDAARVFAFWHCGRKEVLSEQLIVEFKKAFE
jgi:hypothetical protein